MEEHGVELGWDDGLLDYLVKKSYSVTYGARNLRRTIQKDIEDPIAEAIIDSFTAPIRTIQVHAEDEKIRLETK